MENNLKRQLARLQTQISQAKSAAQLEKLRISMLGRKGIINQLFARISSLPQSERQRQGLILNKIKKDIESALQAQAKQPKPDEVAAEKMTIKYQLVKLGHLHPITVTENEINQLFEKMGFSIYTGPEIETDEYCFRRLNVPVDHPARDLQDSIYIKEPEILLSSQTSSIEAHLLENEKPPFKAAFPGRVYRNEKVTKSNHFIFHQYQGVAVDRKISLKDLIGVFGVLFTHLYGKEAVVRYRCKYYPEVEPGLGLDLRCFNCQGGGCPLCKGVGWIEMGGAGIIHPKVMAMAGINPKEWRGFAFGLGLDRWTMAKYNIEDIRTLTGGNLAYKPNLP